MYFLYYRVFKNFEEKILETPCIVFCKGSRLVERETVVGTDFLDFFVVVE